MICFITAVGEMNRLSAALVKLPQSATQVKTVSKGLNMAGLLSMNEMITARKVWTGINKMLMPK